MSLLDGTKSSEPESASAVRSAEIHSSVSEVRTFNAAEMAGFIRWCHRRQLCPPQAEVLKTCQLSEHGSRKVAGRLVGDEVGNLQAS
jgi:hypothetical protein